ncbi:Hypothetical predicted protein [Pelobates cultripes]|uniref:Uncharacterized protein n=1 Tax=Pelobates cultripes TaxID=61616 RepID=A0AAD1S409_PELCU|nr:Hypothetical predicted protein [Pelobates cultripes]
MLRRLEQIFTALFSCFSQSGMQLIYRPPCRSDSAAESPGKIPHCSYVTEAQRPKLRPSPSSGPPALPDLTLPSSSRDLWSGATERHCSEVLTVDVAEVLPFLAC